MKADGLLSLYPVGCLTLWSVHTDNLVSFSDAARKSIGKEFCYGPKIANNMCTWRAL